MKKGLNILFKGEALEIINRIRNKSGVKTRADVVRDALKLYDEIDKIAKSGKVIMRDYKSKHPEKILEIPRMV